MRKFFRVATLALTVAGLAVVPLAGAPKASAQTADWPPVLSEMAQLTVGNLSGLIIVVTNRTPDQHAFVDIRGYVPGFAKVIDSFAGVPQTNRGKLEGLAPDGQQVGWINHFVRAGRAQGPFAIIVDNTGRTLQSWTWMWFQTGGQWGSGRNRYNGNYVSPQITTDSPISATPGLGGALPGAGGAR